MNVPCRDSSELVRRLESLSGAAIGLDTEFLRERTYFAKLCLVQIADTREAFCVDTLALEDGRILARALSDPGRIKVLHAARQDLEVLYSLAGRIEPVFDTQVAAALCGFAAQVGYAELVRELLGVTLDKAHTRADWSKRPLAAAEIEYALDDVRYLLALRERLAAQLDELGRADWFGEEMQSLQRLEFTPPDPSQAWLRLKGLGDLDEARQRVAQSIAAWREQRAIQSDRPRGWILPDNALREISLRVPRSQTELARIADLPEGIRANSGGQLLALIDALNLPANLPPLRGRPRPDPNLNALAQRLSAITRAVATELQLAPELLATRRDIDALIAGAREIGPLRGWRRAEIGERLLQAL